MKWFRVDANFSRRINIDILADDLGASDLAARGIVVSLWAATADLWEDGDLAGVSPRALAKAIGWSQEPGTLIRALVAAGYLQTSATGALSVVNWDTIGRPLMDTRNRQARKRIRSRDSNVTVPLPSCDSHVTVTQHDTTRHDTSQDSSSLTSSCVASSSVFSARAREAVADAGQEGPGLDPPASDPEMPKPDGASAEQPEELAAQAESGESGAGENPEPGAGPAWWSTAEQHFRARFGERGPSDHDLAELWKLLGDTRVVEADLAGAIRNHRLRDSLAPPIEDLAGWIVRQARTRMAERLAGRNGHGRLEREPSPEEEAWKGRCRTALQGLYGPVCPSDIERRKFEALLAAGPHETEILEAVRIAGERERAKPPHVPYIAKIAVELAAGRKERTAAREQAARQAETARAADILFGGRP